LRFQRHAVYYNRVAYLLAVFYFVSLLFTLFICMYVFLVFATTSLVNKDLYYFEYLRFTENSMQTLRINITDELSIVH